MKTADFSNVTEVPGARASREQAAMLYTRYAFAARLCRGKEILEVACGSGMGLGFLARTAKRVVGGDCTQGLLRQARKHYGARIPLVRLDAHGLPFRDSSFDAIILYEAIYYLADPSLFLQECRRVLREGGSLIVCSP
ncbi:MAG: class I SAM-dependent methyltransferase [Chloroflexota bacterium]